MSSSRILKFRQTVWEYWKENGRHDLPWRSPSLKLRRTKEILDPYRVLVSEVMLQQTQVPRVQEKYKEFLKKFPTVRALAKAPLADVLRVWSGLGYNRRAKYLRDAAKTIVAKHKGKVPKDVLTLRLLPGMGLYTASALRVFAFNEPDILIETNIRTAFIHHFWPFHKSSDRPRYGTVADTKFEGSLRQVRGAILKALSRHETINDLRSRYKKQFQKALKGLARDGLIVKQRGKWRIA